VGRRSRCAKKRLAAADSACQCLHRNVKLGGAHTTATWATSDVGACTLLARAKLVYREVNDILPADARSVLADAVGHLRTPDSWPTHEPAKDLLVGRRRLPADLLRHIGPEGPL